MGEVRDGGGVGEVYKRRVRVRARVLYVGVVWVRVRVRVRFCLGVGVMLGARVCPRVVDVDVVRVRVSARVLHVEVVRPPDDGIRLRLFRIHI